MNQSILLVMKLYLLFFTCAIAAIYHAPTAQAADNNAIVIIAPNDKTDAFPGDTVEYTYIISNTTTEKKTVFISASTDVAEWTTSPTNSNDIEVPPNTSKEISVNVFIPTNVSNGDQARTTVTLEDSDSLVTFNSVFNETTIVSNAGFDLTVVDSPLTGAPGETVEFTVQIASTAADQDALTVRVIGQGLGNYTTKLIDAYGILVNNDRRILQSGSQIDVIISVEIPSDVTENTASNLSNISVTSSNNTELVKEVELHIEVTADPSEIVNSVSLRRMNTGAERIPAAILLFIGLISLSITSSFPSGGG